MIEAAFKVVDHEFDEKSSRLAYLSSIVNAATFDSNTVIGESAMRSIHEFWSTRLSRRSLFKGAASVAGATAILFTAAYSARAAKMSKPSVAYQPSPKSGAKCANCSLFVAPNACQSVEGPISPNGWCSIYSKA